MLTSKDSTYLAVAPASAAKAEMVIAVRSDEESELRRIQDTWPSEVILGAELRRMLQEH